VNSDVVREAVVEWFFSTLSSGLDQPTQGAIIVMQRLHQYDLAGMLVERGWRELEGVHSGYLATASSVQQPLEGIHPTSSPR